LVTTKLKEQCQHFVRFQLWVVVCFEIPACAGKELLLRWLIHFQIPACAGKDVLKFVENNKPARTMPLGWKQQASIPPAAPGYIQRPLVLHQRPIGRGYVEFSFPHCLLSKTTHPTPFGCNARQC